MSRPHSVKVPTQYRKAAALLTKAISEKKSIKSLIYRQTHVRLNKLMALMGKFSDNRDAVEQAIEKTQILVKNPQLNPSLARVLITELLFGLRTLPRETCKPVACVLSFKDKLEEAIGELSSASSKKAPNPRYARINSNIAATEEVSKELEYFRRKEPSGESYDDFLHAVQSLEEDEYLVDIHNPNLLVFHAKLRSEWAQHPLVADRKIILQDKATSIVAILLDPKPGATVLDMCAAPGIKTIQLSNIVENKGTIYSIEQDESRYKTLCTMISEAQATCVKPINADVLAINDEDVPGVEYILVDPSCSGSGMQNRFSIHQSERKDKARLRKLAGLQIKILRHAMTQFPKAKRIVYSTCSIFEEENEQVVQRCLELCPNFKLLNGKKCLKRKWNNVGNIKYTGIGKNCLYSVPDKDFTDGIFMAVFERINTDAE